MRNNLSKLQYSLLVGTMLAMTGCGAHNLAGNANQSVPGSMKAKLVWKDAKTAKTVASAPAGITSIVATVTGTGTDGKAIPVVRGSISATTDQGSIGGIYPGKVTLSIKAMNGNTVAYEGYAIGVGINANAETVLANPIQMKTPVTKAADANCASCHDTMLDVDGQNLVANFKVKSDGQSAPFADEGHYSNSDWNTNAAFGVTGTGCAGCHGPNHNVANPATAGRCFDCHGTNIQVSHKGMGVIDNKCRDCHQPHNVKNFNTGSCISCHALPQNATAQGSFVNDNNGVRAVVGEFSKWSHHVTGVKLQDAHCAACHLEGKASNGKIVIDTTYHMVNNTTHLRNADTDADFAWNPASPNFTTLDNFCLSCHDANGATSPASAQIRAIMIPAANKVASAGNPFGDTISNRYDKMERPAVVDAKGQFSLSNPSHHAVLGQKYTGRTRAAGARQIAAPATFAANSSAVLYGARSTIYDSRVSGNSQFGAYNVSKFVETYQTLSPAPGTSDATLGDDSVLHCADCHTVGQYSAISPIAKNNAVIGAHGSNNEYLLRNFAGTDERHVGQAYSTDASKNNLYVNPTAPAYNGTVLTSANQPWLVCFNCHSYQNYGSIGNATNITGTNHAGEYANANRCNGPANTIPFAGYTTGTATDGEQYVSRLGEGYVDGLITGSTSTSDSDFSNLFGIQCLNCHNSGPNNAFGGIHGSKVQTYTDANGNVQKAYRFLPGLGNTMFVPGSLGAGQGTVSDLNWEQKALGTSYNAGKTAVVDNSGCYTLVPDTDAGLNLTTTASYTVSPTSGQKAYDGTTAMFGTWGGCDDHRGNAHGKAFANSVAPFDGGTSPTGGAGAVRKVLRPVTY